MRHDEKIRGLLAYLDSARGVPFDLVNHNCALFVAGAIKAATGVDHVARLGIVLSSAADVSATLTQFGGLKGVCEAALGPMQPPLLARRGDVMLKPGSDGDTLGVCVGDHAVFLGPDGTQTRQLAECEGCFRA